MTITPTHTKNPAGTLIIGGNFQGLGVLRSLAKQNIPVYLIDQGLCIGRFSKYTKHFSKCPHINKENIFLDFLSDLSRKESLQGWVIYPNDDETVRFLAVHKEQLEKYYRLITPSWDIVKIIYNKKSTHDAAKKCGIPSPITFCPASIQELNQLDIPFPAVIKPSIKEPFYSHTKKKAILVNDRATLIEEYSNAVKFIGSSQTLLVQEFIPGGTAGLFSVGSLSRNGELLAKVVAHRTRQHPMDFGHATTFAETVDIPELEQMAAKILGGIGFHGLSEVEFMLDSRDNKFKLLEINARPWGWHTLAIAAGVDLPYLSYLDALGERVKKGDFIKGVKWIRLTTDIPTAAIEIFKGRLKIGEYLSSLRGVKHDAVFSLKDPLPFIAELMMLPYLWIKRGF